jgi:hypothetical protein
VSSTVGSALVHRERALVERVHLADLCGAWCCRKGKVRVTPCFGENLHFVVHATKATLGGIGEGKIAMNESVPRSSPSVRSRKTSAGHQSISELGELSSSIFSRVRPYDAVVKVNLDLSPTGAAVFCQAID